jgi:predicted DNA-binding transcriptional regulator YafY
VRFGYTDFHGRPSSRHAEPLRLVYSGQHWYLVARDVDRDAWRVFRADRVTEPLDTAARFTLHDPPDAAAVVAGAVATAPYTHQARILLNMPADRAVRRFPPNSSIVEALGPDRCLLIVGSDSLDAMALHLGVLDVEFTVLEPAELRERMRLVAERLRVAAGGSQPDASRVDG